MHTFTKPIITFHTGWLMKDFKLKSVAIHIAYMLA